MKTKEELWQKFCVSNSSFETNEIKLTSEQLKKIVETSWKYAFNAGFDRGKEVAKSLNDLIDKSGGKSKDDFADMVKDILNKKK